MKIGQTIYLDHQATTPVDSRVLTSMAPYFEELFGNPHSTDHSIGWSASKAVETSVNRIAALIGSDPDEIIFTSGATESNNLALLGLCRRNTNKTRNKVLLSSIEHKSVLAVGCVLRAQLGYDVRLLPVDNKGHIIISELEQLLDENVLIVSIMAVNNEIGTIQDIELISEMVRGVGAAFHCDAAQAPTAVNLNNIVDRVDFLSLSSHKMWGPKGVGVLYIRRELQYEVEPLIYGGNQQNGIRSGTIPVPLCVGMGTAAEIYSLPTAVDERHQLRAVRDGFFKGLQDLPFEIVLNGPEGSMRHPGNVNVCFKGFSAHDILGTLQPYLAASTGSACTSGITEPSHVLTAIGLNEADAEASVRFSLGRKTTQQTLQKAVDLIKSTLEKLSNNRAQTV